MFDYGSSRRPYGINGAGLVTLNRREKKDAYYLYKAMWNGAEPTLHIVDKRRRLRDYEKQAFRVYSSAGTPTLIVGRDTLAMSEYAPFQYRSDSVAIHGMIEVKAAAGDLRDSVTILVGNVLKPKRTQVLRRTAGPGKRQIRDERHPFGEDLEIRLGDQRRAFFAFGAQVEVSGGRLDIRPGEFGHRHSGQRTQHLQQTQIVIGEELPLPAVERLEPPA